MVNDHLVVFTNDIDAKFLTKNEKKINSKSEVEVEIRHGCLILAPLSVLRHWSLMKVPLELLTHLTSIYHRRMRTMITNKKVAMNLCINPYFSMLLAQWLRVNVNIEVSMETMHALISLPMLMCWLLMCLTKESALGGYRYRARNALGIIVVVIDQGSQM
jgi:hypothetical protein